MKLLEVITPKELLTRAKGLLLCFQQLLLDAGYDFEPGDAKVESMVMSGEGGVKASGLHVIFTSPTLKRSGGGPRLFHAIFWLDGEKAGETGLYGGSATRAKGTFAYTRIGDMESLIGSLKRGFLNDVPPPVSESELPALPTLVKRNLLRAQQIALEIGLDNMIDQELSITGKGFNVDFSNGAGHQLCVELHFDGRVLMGFIDEVKVGEGASVDEAFEQLRKKTTYPSRFVRV